MPPIPPKPANSPAIGSVWYCQAPGGWPGPWKPQARWGNPIDVTDVVYSSNVWKVRFNTHWNPYFGYVGCTIPVSQFYSFFGDQKLLVTKQGWGSGGEGSPRNLLRAVRGEGHMYTGGGYNNQILGLRVLSASVSASSVLAIKPTLQRT